MADIIERAKTMITTLEYAQLHGIAQAYPDSIIKDITVDLVAEIERLRGQLTRVRVVAINAEARLREAERSGF